KTSMLILLLYFIFSDLTFAYDVIQTPEKVLEHPGKTVKLQCEYDGTTTNYIYWYRQVGEGGLSLIGYSVGVGIINEEAEFKASRFVMNRNETKKSTLKIQPLESADTAVYFCASSMTQ
uniref:Ig-like domain-containing protein n=1 Tax=Lepisosteus oculatus TaxID=7918 RepID=W5NMG4_LEPOC